MRRGDAASSSASQGEAAHQQPKKIGALEAAGIDVQRESHQLGANPYNLRYLKTKARKSGHMLDFKEEAL